RPAAPQRSAPVPAAGTGSSSTGARRPGSTSRSSRSGSIPTCRRSACRAASASDGRKCSGLRGGASPVSFRVMVGIGRSWLVVLRLVERLHRPQEGDEPRAGLLDVGVAGGRDDAVVRVVAGPLVERGGDALARLAQVPVRFAGPGRVEPLGPPHSFGS